MSATTTNNLFYNKMDPKDQIKLSPRSLHEVQKVSPRIMDNKKLLSPSNSLKKNDLFLKKVEQPQLVLQVSS